MFLETGCDAVLIARGTFGQPWIIEDVYRKLSGEPPVVRSGEDYKRTLLQHFDHVVSYCTDRKAVTDMRRIGCWFLKGTHGARALREAINHAKSVSEIRSLIVDYTWQEVCHGNDPREELA